jgi:hypothetical protein
METIGLDEVGKIATRVAKESLGQERVKKAIGSATVDSLGRDALEIVIELTPGSSSAITGQAAATTVFNLNKGLQAAGEERFPIIRWVE